MLFTRNLLRLGKQSLSRSLLRTYGKRGEKMAQGWFVNSAFTQLFLRGHSDVSSLGSSNLKLKDGEDRETRSCKEEYPNGFQIPLHYPRYTKQDYDNMADFKLDMLLKEYGLSFKGSLEEKRAYAIGAFLWPQS